MASPVSIRQRKESQNLYGEEASDEKALSASPGVFINTEVFAHKKQPPHLGPP
jgi:hypothetical protein